MDNIIYKSYSLQPLQFRQVSSYMKKHLKYYTQQIHFLQSPESEKTYNHSTFCQQGLIYEYAQTRSYKFLGPRTSILTLIFCS